MIKSFLISCISLIATFILVELCFRLLPAQKPKPWSDRPAFYYQHEHSETLQDYPFSEVKTEGIFRIAVVGDSFSFAPYMQFDDAFPKKLERMLNLQSKQQKAEVLNYGVPAYSTSHEVAVVKRAIENQSDLILLQITLNDPEIKAGTPIGITVFDKFGPPKYGPFLGKIINNSKLASFIAGRLHNSKTQREYREYFFDLYENPKSWGLFQKSLAQIAEIAKTANKPIVAIIFPLFGLPMDQTYPFYPIHEKVSKALTDLNIKHKDISDVYEGIPLDRLQVIPGVDRHPNEIGHRMAAEAIYEWLRQEQLLPEDILIKKKFKGRTQIIKEEAYLD